MQGQNMPPILQNIKFGVISGRWWKRHDHLVIVGHNKADESFFVFDPRRLNAQVKELTGPFSGPDKRTVTLFKGVEDIDANFWRNSVRVCEYVGSLHITERAISFRHFVFVEVDYLPPIPTLGPVVLDLTHSLKICVGRFQAPIVAEIIADRYPGTVALLARQFPSLAKKAA